MYVWSLDLFVLKNVYTGLILLNIRSYSCILFIDIYMRFAKSRQEHVAIGDAYGSLFDFAAG